MPWVVTARWLRPSLTLADTEAASVRPVRSLGQLLRRPIRRTSVLRLALGWLVGLSLVACGSPELNDNVRAQALLDLEARATATGIELEREESECAVDEFDSETALGLSADELTSPVAESVAEAIVGCDEDSRIGGLVLRPLAPGAGVESLACASAELGDVVIVRLLAAELAQSNGLRSIDELEVVAALSLCLSPEELLDYYD